MRDFLFDYKVRYDFSWLHNFLSAHWVSGSNLICLFNCYYIIYKNNNDFKRHGAFRIFAKAGSDEKRKKPHTLEGENEV